MSTEAEHQAGRRQAWTLSRWWIRQLPSCASGAGRTACTGLATSSPLTGAAPPAARHVSRLTPMLTGEAPRRARGTATETRSRWASTRARGGSPHEHWTRARPGGGPRPAGRPRTAPPPGLVRPRWRPHVELPGDPPARGRLSGMPWSWRRSAATGCRRCSSGVQGSPPRRASRRTTRRRRSWRP